MTKPPMRFTPIQLRKRRLLRLAQIIFDHYEEGFVVDILYFQHPLINNSLTLWGTSIKGGGHRQHVVPRAFVRDSSVTMLKEGRSIDDVTAFLHENLWDVEITTAEAASLQALDAPPLALALLETTAKPLQSVMTFPATKSAAEKVALSSNPRIRPILDRLESAEMNCQMQEQADKRESAQVAFERLKAAGIKLAVDSRWASLK